MAEFIYIEEQNIQPGANALLNSAIGCNRGYVIHRPGSGIVTLRGIVNNPCARFARYKVEYSANIALPTGATVGEIQAAIALDGEVLQSSLTAVTPAAVNNYFNVTGFAIIDVPAGCCYTVAIENASESATPATVPAPAILMRNLNVEVSRQA